MAAQAEDDDDNILLPGPDQGQQLAVRIEHAIRQSLAQPAVKRRTARGGAAHQP